MAQARVAVAHHVQRSFSGTLRMAGKEKRLERHQKVASSRSKIAAGLLPSLPKSELNHLAIKELL